jgi:quinolinate synthase
MLDLYDNDNQHLPTIGLDEISDEQVILEIEKLKSEMKDELVILGHHYQQDDVIRFADYSGDSLELAKVVADLKDKKYTLFCGVHFMAETTDMLSADHQVVILPDLNAGCSMADMANEFEIDKAWEFISSATDEKVVPITYINCAATLKAFVGKNNGSICTSSNAEKIITWALTQGEKLLFFPDQHLGRNTCFKLGIGLDEMVVYDPTKKNGGLTREQIQNAKVILWYGYCSVHQGFKIEQIDQWRKKSPETTIIVHPECNFEVTQAADMAGSTSYIINQIKKAAPGSKFAVGTEINLVNRLAKDYPELEINSLSAYQCLCTTMYRVRPRWLLESLRAIKRGTPINVIEVSPEITKFSLKALNQMLAI